MYKSLNKIKEPRPFPPLNDNLKNKLNGIQDKTFELFNEIKISIKSIELNELTDIYFQYAKFNLLKRVKKELSREGGLLYNYKKEKKLENWRKYSQKVFKILLNKSRLHHDLILKQDEVSKTNYFVKMSQRRDCMGRALKLEKVKENTKSFSSKKYFCYIKLRLLKKVILIHFLDKNKTNIDFKEFLNSELHNPFVLELFKLYSPKPITHETIMISNEKNEKKGFFFTLKDSRSSSSSLYTSPMTETLNSSFISKKSQHLEKKIHKEVTNENSFLSKQSSRSSSTFITNDNAYYRTKFICEFVTTKGNIFGIVNIYTSCIVFTSTNRPENEKENISFANSRLSKSLVKISLFSNINEILLKRYCLERQGAEIYESDNTSWLLIFQNRSNCKQFFQAVLKYTKKASNNKITIVFDPEKYFYESRFMSVI